MNVLAGDIGGTHTRLMSAQTSTGAYMPSECFVNRNFDSFEAIVAQYLRRHDLSTPSIAVLAVAAPVNAGDTRVRLTNHHWELNGATLATQFGISETRLLNDFYAIALGVEQLRGKDTRALQVGAASAFGNRAVLGAGTGLGHALLLRERSNGYRVVASEAGHADFAPSDAEQVALHRFLAARHGHVSWERVLSGPGLVAAHEFFSGQNPNRAGVHAPADAASISRHAMDAPGSLERRVLDLFVRVYGAQAGNFALTTLCSGGLYLAGGIARAILPALEDGSFMRAFLDKGRFAERLQEVPVHVILDENVALRGAITSVAQ